MSDVPFMRRQTKVEPYAGAENPPVISNDVATSKFDMQGIDRHIESFGIPVLWEKSYICPCRTKETKQPSQTCPRCSGRGIAYRPSKRIVVALQAQVKGISYNDVGYLDTGSAIGTPERAGLGITFRDRITVPDFLVAESMIFDVTEFRITNGMFMHYAVKSLDFVTTLERELVEGEDFTFNYETNKFFPNESLIGQTISLNLSAVLRYIVHDILKDHRSDVQVFNGEKVIEPLPKNLFLKREDVFVPTEAFSFGNTDEQYGQFLEVKRQPSTEGLNGFFGRDS